jgi:hypothetical protein
MLTSQGYHAIIWSSLVSVEAIYRAAPMIDPRENREDYQRALAWVGEQISEAARQGLTLDYLGGWHRFQANPKTLERAWRVLYGIPDSMTDLLTSPEMQWALVIWRWEQHRHERGSRGG